MSGVDTNTMVQQMMRAESQRMNRMQQRSQTLRWQQAAIVGVSTNLRDFQTGSVSPTGPNSIRLQSNFQSTTRGATIDGRPTNSVNVTGGSSPGNHELTIEQIAEAERNRTNSVGGTLNGDNPLDSSTVQAGDTIRVTVNGTSRNITFTEADINRINAADDGNEEFTNILNERLTTSFGNDINGQPRVTASIGDNGQLVMTPQAGNSVRIEEVPRVQDTTTDGFDIDSLRGQEFRMNVNGRDIYFDVTENMTEAQFVNELNRQLSANGGTGVTASLRDGEITFAARNTNAPVTISGAQGLGLDGDVTLGATNVLSGLGIRNGASSQFNPASNTISDLFELGEGEELSFSINGVDFNFAAGTTVQDAMNTINRSAAGVNVTFNATGQTFDMAGTRTGYANGIVIGGDDAARINGAFSNQITQAQDSIFTFNGDRTSRDSNNIDIGGLQFTLNQVTEADEVIIINIGNDNTTARDTIENWVEEYNQLTRDLNAALNTQRPRGNTGQHFVPLTDEQRAAMSDREIEDWERQAQIGLTHNDAEIRRIQSDMRRMIQEPVTLPDGSTISLNEIGITTNRDGTLSINDEQLDRALTERGDDVMHMFTASSPSGDYMNHQQFMAGQGIGNRLDVILNNAVGTNGSLSNRAGSPDGGITSVSNSMTRELDRNSRRIDAELVRLQRREESLFNMFARMERSIMHSDAMMATLHSSMGF
jgi:flagellar hook-associated protein 2